jgi:hypothetical protein
MRRCVVGHGLDQIATWAYTLAQLPAAACGNLARCTAFDAKQRDACLPKDRPRHGLMMFPVAPDNTRRTATANRHNHKEREQLYCHYRFNP